jgi:RNA polymerase sigma factor (sigma-70 family)
MHDELAGALRVEGARILATLVRTVGDLAVAEDAVQDAVEVALQTWPRDGVPAEPRAWLTVAARRKAIDLLRRDAARGDKEAAAVELEPDEPPPGADAVRDDQLRLIFTCCHPALAPESRLALALRTLCGLSTEQVAAVMLATPAATAKRLTRARRKIAVARIPYRVPPAAELPARCVAVSGVIHALYTSGHAAIDVDSCAEALRLARLLRGLLPDEPAPAAVLALLLLTEARRPTRTDAAGDIVTLAEQERASWDRPLIAEGVALLDESLRRTAGVADPHQLQAAIARQHALAPSYAATDWPEVVRLYDLLLCVAPSPAAALARAVAIAEADGPEAGLAGLEPIPPDPRWHAVRAELLARTGRYDEAVAAVDAALAGPQSAPERR